MDKKTALLGGGAAATLTAVAAIITSVYGTHSTTTTHDTSKDPVVINRPTYANGSPKPIQVIQPSDGGRPIVIVGDGAPCAQKSHTSSPRPTPPALSPTRHKKRC